MKKTRRANRKPKRKTSAKPKKSATRAQPHPAISFGTDGWRGIMARDFTIENATRCYEENPSSQSQAQT